MPEHLSRLKPVPRLAALGFGLLAAAVAIWIARGVIEERMLLQRLTARDEKVRLAAAAALGSMKSKAGVQAILELPESAREWSAAANEHDESKLQDTDSLAHGELVNEWLDVVEAYGLQAWERNLEIALTRLDHDLSQPRNSPPHDRAVTLLGFLYFRDSPNALTRQEGAELALKHCAGMQTDDCSEWLWFVKVRHSVWADAHKLLPPLIGLVDVEEGLLLEDASAAARAIDPASSELIEALIGKLLSEKQRHSLRAAAELHDVPAATDRLLQVAQGNDRSQQLAAIRALSSPVAIPVLAEFAQGEEPEFRRQALEALGRVNSETSVSIVATHARDRDLTIAATAIRQLGRSRTRTAARILIDLARSSDSYITVKALEAMSSLNDNFLEERIEAVLDTLSDSTEPIRAAATHALWRLLELHWALNTGRSETPSRSQVPHALRPFRQFEEETRAGVTWAFAAGRLGEMLSVALQDPSPLVRRQTLRALRSFPRFFSPPGYLQPASVLRGVIRCLQDTDLSVSRAAERLLRPDDLPLFSTAHIHRFQDVLQEPELLESFPVQREPVRVVLAAAASRVVADDLITLALADPSPLVRHTALDDLSGVDSLAEPVLNSILHVCLTDSDAQVRWAAAHLIGRRPGYAGDLIAALEGTKRQRWSGAALALESAALESHIDAAQGERLIPTLIQRINHGDRETREACAPVLSILRPEAMVDLLVTQLVSKDSRADEEELRSLAALVSQHPRSVSDALRILETNSDSPATELFDLAAASNCGEAAATERFLREMLALKFPRLRLLAARRLRNAGLAPPTALALLGDALQRESSAEVRRELKGAVAQITESLADP